MIEIIQQTVKQLEITRNNPALIDVIEQINRFTVELKPIQSVVVVEPTPPPQFISEIIEPQVFKVDVVNQPIRQIEVIIGTSGSATNATNAERALEISFDAIAGEDLSALKFVYLDVTGKAFRGDYTTTQNSNVIGITKTGASLGGTVRILAFGRIDDASFAYSSGQVLYLTTLGNVSTTAPNNPPASYRKPVAQGLQTGSIFVNIREAITLIP